jgi:hypothetical protein
MFYIEGVCNKLNFMYYFFNFKEIPSILISGVPEIILHNFRVPSVEGGGGSFRTAAVYC